MNRKFYLLILGTLFLSACSLYRVDSDETALEFLPAKLDSSPLEFIPTRHATSEIEYIETVNRPHEIIGTILVNTERRWDKEEVLRKIKREAALIGGDGVTNIQEKPPAIKKDFLKNAYLRTNYTADVVKFTGGDQDIPVAAPIPVAREGSLPPAAIK